jgi:hypothetical protein
MSFNPDLVVSMDGSDRDTVIATGDVKYRVRDGLWPRSTFEQMVVFAEVFNSPQGFFIDFEIGDVLETSNTEIIEGRKYHRLSWRANPNTEPLKAALDLVEGCRDLLGLNQSLSHGVTVQ